MSSHFFTTLMQHHITNQAHEQEIRRLSARCDELATELIKCRDVLAKLQIPSEAKGAGYKQTDTVPVSGIHSAHGTETRAPARQSWI